MRYAIRGNFVINDQQDVLDTIQKYPLWKPLVKTTYMDDEGLEWVTCEALLNAEEDKTYLFEELKTLVNYTGEWIDWHECTHDENISKPCVIQEDYRK
jgi:hypothetical protein